MKLSNIFKKETKKTIQSNIQALDKNQLSKVIGGTETIVATTEVAKASDGKKHFEVTA